MLTYKKILRFITHPRAWYDITIKNILPLLVVNMLWFLFNGFCILLTHRFLWVIRPFYFRSFVDFSSESPVTAIYLIFYLVLRAKKLKKADYIENIQVWTGVKTKKARKHWVCGLNKIFWIRARCAWSPGAVLGNKVVEIEIPPGGVAMMLDEHGLFK